MKLYRLGDTNTNFYGSKMTIIEYNNCNDVVVKFDNSYKVKVRYDEFKKGLVKNPYDKSVCGVGYLGEGCYTTFSQSNPNPAHRAWGRLLTRCYNLNFQKTSPTYSGCSVCEEWYNFQNFAKWYESNYYEIGNEKMEIGRASCRERV